MVDEDGGGPMGDDEEDFLDDQEVFDDADPCEAAECRQCDDPDWDEELVGFLAGDWAIDGDFLGLFGF